MGFLDRAKLLEKEKLEIVKVDLGNDEFVYVKQMTAREKDHWERSMMREVKDTKGRVVSYEQALEDFRAKLAVVTVCDEKGVPLLTVQDTVLLSQNIGATKLEKIVTAAQKLNAITEEDKEDLVKNLEAAKGGNSSSASAVH